MTFYRGVAEKLVERYDYEWRNNIRLKEACICSVEMLVANVVNICIVALVALVLKIPREVFVFFATFAALRFYAGGIHARNYRECISVYVCVLLASIYTVKQCIGMDSAVVYLLVIISMVQAVIVNYKFAAKNNGCKDRIAEYRRKTFWVLGVIESVMLLLEVALPYIKNEMIQDIVKETLLIQVCALLVHSASLYLSCRKKEVQDYQS